MGRSAREPAIPAPPSGLQAHQTDGTRTRRPGKRSRVTALKVLHRRDLRDFAPQQHTAIRKFVFAQRSRVIGKSVLLKRASVPRVNPREIHLLQPINNWRIGSSCAKIPAARYKSSI